MGGLSHGSHQFERRKGEVPMNWLTTAPNPRTSATGHDAGQRGWKLHAVNADDTKFFGEIRFMAALCGLRPAHGWGLDAFVEDKCARCEAALSKRQMRYGILWTGFNGSQSLCEIDGGVCYVSFHSLADATSEAASLNTTAITNGYSSRYQAVALPTGTRYYNELTEEVETQ